MLLTSTDEKEFVLKFSKFVNEENSILLILEFENSIGYLSRNINAKILFFELSLQISKMLRIKSSND
jgi:DNA polymerase-3 subunit delta'